MILSISKIKKKLKDEVFEIYNLGGGALNFENGAISLTLGKFITEIKEICPNTRAVLSYIKHEISPSGFLFQRNILYLSSSNEYLYTPSHAGLFVTPPYLAALFVDTHYHSYFGQLGINSSWTLEIRVSKPVVLYHNSRIGLHYVLKKTSNSIGSENYYGRYYGQKDRELSRLESNITKK